MKTLEQIRARSAARKAEQAIDGPKAMREYRAAEAATRARTAQLRADRLAREAATARRSGGGAGG
jgi:hypothetical protein